MDDVPLLIDQRSASQAASEGDIKAWANGRRVFVSSLITDMPEERAAVRNAIQSVGATPVMFEDLGAQDISAEQAYLSGVRNSEVYIGMWGPRYGVRMPDGYSATHAEFIEAEQNGLRLCLFVHDESGSAMDGPQRDLIQSARNLYTTSPWGDPADLGRRVRRRLEALASEELAPWVRLGRTLFRAREITSDGRTISLMATVRSDAVHAELVRLRDNGAGPTPFASPHAAVPVQITELTTTIISTNGHDERVTMATQGQRMTNMRASMNGVSADEVARRSFSDGLFATSMLDPQLGWLARPIDPLAQLRGLNLDDSVLRPVARLLLFERLITEQAASRLDSFALSPSYQGTRRLRATWTPPRSYTDGPEPAPVAIDGAVRGL